MKKISFWALGILPVVITAVLLRSLPERVPVHYGANGATDAYGSKYLLFLTAFIPLLSLLTFRLTATCFNKKARNSNNDKVKKECENNVKSMRYLEIAAGVFFNLLQYYFLYLAFKAAENVSVTFSDGIVVIGLGVFMILIGNIMPKASPNAVFGLRTHWSGKNDKTWALSQKQGGIMLVIDGLLMIICGTVIKNEVIFSIAVLVIIFSIVPASYVISYLAFKKY